MARLTSIAQWLRETQTELEGLDPVSPRGRYLRKCVHDLEKLAAEHPQGTSALVQPGTIRAYIPETWDW